eukprot:CAMPEP_0118678828 /NCGR_PEP_ID=MMETSP0800-20121206/3439_1 /TAXON_ID=210618 ORGANISM="Striatella unipunctata, Strain CCMP2910" /NCGR_SAMPLE_ID=MMETSP0800 /ASSEMBLY_ACC=CAM_ASM_000638 /LENGTH=566 /DNA_ID=CAMNT_0006574735 /DNA_START=363 /DNA_END=2063 /DNA_ORIENTATION=+
MGIFLTWGELFLLLPIMGFLVWGAMASFCNPSVVVSGHAARSPLALAFITGTHNSAITFLLGMPFERSLFYHKLCGRIAFLNGIMHAYVAFATYQQENRNDGDDTSPHEFDVVDDMFLFETSAEKMIESSFKDQVNSSGTMLQIFLLCIVLSSVPYIRHKLFEVFYFLHILFAISMVVCAFYHSGTAVVILANTVWVGDLLLRKIIMACFMYPVKAAATIMTETVIKIEFEKTKTFDYNPGQYVFLCVPEISLFQWHPFSLSSSPHSDQVTLHIRRAGNWTEQLYKLAQTKSDISILLEGPYGSLGVDLISDRYKMVMLVSGGIGVTPMQSITHQLMYEHENCGRDLKKIWFVWSASDPLMMNGMEVVRRKSARDLELKNMHDDEQQSPHTPQLRHSWSGLLRSSRIGEILLTRIPMFRDTTKRIEEDLPLEEYLEDHQEEDSDLEGTSHTVRTGSDDDCSSNSVIKSKLRQSTTMFNDDHEVLELKVFLTGQEPLGELDYEFVSRGRPQMKDLFLEFRKLAIQLDERRVAVCVCAPKRLVEIARHACVKYSNESVRFDFHAEQFE